MKENSLLSGSFDGALQREKKGMRELHERMKDNEFSIPGDVITREKKVRLHLQKNLSLRP